MFYKPEKVKHIWDTWLYLHEGTCYLYQLIVDDRYCGQGVCLATSRDGVFWREHGPIFHKLDNAAGLGTGYVWKSPNFERDGRFLMNFSEWFEDDINSQIIRFAQSTDLVHWERLGEDCDFPPDPRWYNTYPNEKGSRWDCIYPLARPGGGYYGYWTATPKDRPGFAFGMTEDGAHWQALSPPEIEWGDMPPLAGIEVGGIEKIGDKYYLMLGGSNGPDGINGMFCFTGEKPEGPFRPAPANFGLLNSDKDHFHTYFARFFPTKEAMLINHHSRTRSGETCFAPLKYAEVDLDGVLRLAWWAGNEILRGPLVTNQLLAPRQTPLGLLSMIDSPLDVQGGLFIEAVLPAAAQAAGNAVGFYIECHGGRHGVILLQDDQRVQFGVAEDDGERYVCEQVVDHDQRFGDTMKCVLLIKGEYTELYLRDRLISGFSLSATPTGRIGSFLPSDKLWAPWVWRFRRPEEIPADVTPHENAAIYRAHEAMASAAPLVRRDQKRPVWHFCPPAGWMNDVNGPLFWQGYYHIFYQSTPFKASFGDYIYWGHARSRDLVHWELLPHAIWPDAEELGCWSGTACITATGQPLIVYSSSDRWVSEGRGFSQNGALPCDDDLIVWRKHPDNPLLAYSTHAQPGFALAWRDPFIFTHQGRAFMILGGTERGTPIYEAETPDYNRWRYRGQMLDQDAECPNFFRLGEKWVFITSPYGPVNYRVGRFDSASLRFHPEAEGLMDQYNAFYGTNGLYDPHGRCIYLSRLLSFGGRSPRGNHDYGWDGCMALPRILSLGPDNHPRQTPAPELQALRCSPVRHENTNLDRSSHRIKDLRGDTLEIIAKFVPQGAAGFGLKVRCGEDGARGTTITCNGRSIRVHDALIDHTFALDRPADDGAVTLHVFLDKAVLELFVNDGSYVASYIILPEAPGLSVHVFAEGGRALGESLEAWTLQPIA